MIDAQSPGNRQSTKRANLHRNQRTRRRHQGEGVNGTSDYLGGLASSIRYQRGAPQPSASREDRADHDGCQAHENDRVDRRVDEQPSPIISQHSSMLSPPSMEDIHGSAPSGGMQNGTIRPDAHQERRRDGRSLSPRRDRLPSRDILRYRNRKSHEKKQSRACDESLRPSERNRRSEDHRGRCM